MGQPGYPQQPPQNVPPVAPAPYPPQGQAAPQGAYPPPAPGGYPPAAQPNYPQPNYPPPAYPPAPQPAGGGGMSPAVKRGLLQMGLGVGLIVLGIVISVVTYSLASGGGVYFVAWGLPIWGVITIVRGLIIMVRGR